MLNKIRFYIFALLGLGLILNTFFLYPWEISMGLVESSWITIGTIAAVICYYLALKSNYAPFQTFIMRIIFWGFSTMLFLSIMRRTFEYIEGFIPLFAALNTVLYLAIVLFCVFEGQRLFYSYGKNNGNNQKKAPKKSKKEDLTRIEGIGPVIQKALYKNGIQSYEDLASTPAHLIKDILDKKKLNAHDPTTWPKQARLAFEGKFEELDAWQDELMGGRK